LRGRVAEDDTVLLCPAEERAERGQRRLPRLRPAATQPGVPSLENTLLAALGERAPATTEEIARVLRRSKAVVPEALGELEAAGPGARGGVGGRGSGGAA